MLLERIREHLDNRRATVRVDSNYRVYLRRAVFVCAGALLFLAGYFIGVRDYLELGAIDAFKFYALDKSHRSALDLKSRLEQENLQLSVNSQIDARAQEALRDQLVERQIEIKRLNDELLFYRHLHESDKLVEGLRVQSFELRPVPNARGRYRYRSIVSFFSAGTSNAFFEGYYDIHVEARSQDSNAEAGRIRVGPPERSKRRYKFKLIHTIKGEFELDPGFEPARLFFRLQPKSRQVDAVEKIYSFEQLIDSNQQY